MHTQIIKFLEFLSSSFEPHLEHCYFLQIIVNSYGKYMHEKANMVCVRLQFTVRNASLHLISIWRVHGKKFMYIYKLHH